MFVKLVIIVILGIDTFFWHHDTKQDAFVSLQEFSLCAIFEGEVLYHVEFDWYIGCLEDIQHALYVMKRLLVISGPIPMPEIRVTRCASPKLGLWSSALYQVALWPSKKRLALVNNLISTLRLILILHNIAHQGSIYDCRQEIIKNIESYQRILSMDDCGREY